MHHRVRQLHLVFVLFFCFPHLRKDLFALFQCCFIMSPSADLLDNLINLQLPFSAKKKKKTKLDTGEEITLAAVAGVDSPANEGPAHRCEVCSQQASVGLN